MAVALTEQISPELPGLLPLWHDSAPRSVMECSATDGPFGNWPTWQKHLSRRKQPPSPPFLGDKEPALFWGWPTAWRRDELEAQLNAPAGLQALTIRAVLPEGVLDSASPRFELPHALELLLLAYSLPKLARQLPAETWWRIVERLHALAVEGQPYHVDWPGDPRDVVRQQLVAGELPLALGYLFPEIRALRALRKSARAAFSEALIEVTDGQGLPHERLLPVLGPLFACWTRARWLGSQLGQGPWSRKAEFQYRWLVRNALRLADVDGRFVLTPDDPSSPAWASSQFKLALQMAGDAGDLAAAAAALPRRAVPPGSEFTANDLPDPSVNSDWSGIAVLANGWSQTDVRLAVAYADDPLHIELAVDGERMLVGSLLSETTCDGEPVQVTGEWERMCWESGRRFDFLELGVDLSHGLRLERQLLLGRRDKVLYLSDIISAPDGAARRLRHALKLPLDDHDSWRPELETRDGLLVGHRARIAVLPLALREWRSDPRSGELSDNEGCLVLTQETNAPALCCPLFFDLDRKRTKKERTWRQLSIGENLELVPPHAAVGFRAQSGRDQWLFYRSLGPAGNRTFLGQNVSGEFSAGPFSPSGKYKEWIEIEAV